MPEGVRAASPPDGPVVLVTSPHSRRSARGLPLAREALRQLGVRVMEEVPIDRVSRLPELIGDGGARMVVAAGGDGTVGAAADVLAATTVVLGVLPLGNSNDFARSLDIPMRTWTVRASPAPGRRRAAALADVAAHTMGTVDTWDAITSRRNVRAYSERPIAPEDLDRILEAGRRAPSASNRQMWDFIVCTDPSQLQVLSKVWRGAGHVASSMATVVLLAPNTDEDRMRMLAQFDLGQVTMSMMIVAASMGIGSGHSAVGDQDLARRILGFPEDRICAYLIALGYPADRPLTPLKRTNRRPFEEVVHRGRW